MRPRSNRTDLHRGPKSGHSLQEDSRPPSTATTVRGLPCGRLNPVRAVSRGYWEQLFDPRKGLQNQCVHVDRPMDTMSMRYGLGGPAVLNPMNESNGDGNAAYTSNPLLLL